MNTEHYKKLLLAKQCELQDEIGKLKGEVREPPAGVQDPGDEAATSQNKSTALQENKFVTGTLIQVEDALRRIEEGAYGYCQDCGRAIEQLRLEAVPWTPYCLEDQQKRDAESSPVGGFSI